ncbi:MAG: HTTM domain-containing protein [Terriglobales bacterium]
MRWTLRSVPEAWNRFFFAKQSPLPIALFRIAYGLLIIATLVLLRPDWLAWYGPHSWISLQTMQTVEPGTRLNLFTVIPQSDGWINAFFWLFLGSAILLTVGLITRINSVIVFLCLTSIHQRNLYITHGGDTFLRLAGFFLMFAPAGAALSFDRLLRIWRRRTKRATAQDAPLEPQRPWAQRMIQIQLSLLYFAAFCHKVKSPAWRNGTALYYIYHLDSLQRFPVPAWLLHPAMLKWAGWSAIAIELALGVLIWVKSLRYYVLALGLLLHLWLEYSLNISLFQWDVLSAYILFIDPADASRAWNWIKLHIAGRRPIQPA